ncbi:centrosome and spindle pole-associated protein 1 isoform X2 [Coregonus clupeaformis]|uniref:centrosome and spindle pole-associated protein 1 isoform X2 n=1 Tax=Coregonus clupeaformis TaxID=59861 RepID=UPI001BDF920E|nr:centrosome and spindle pole-associated protein 1 isoform X2 [Coregonus clupeaformis]
MEMDDELEKFIQQQKARVAEDKASLERDPPYLEIRTEDHKAHDPTLTNIPTFKSSTAQGKEENCCVSLPLGEDYERKKQKLQQELRLDYRCYMAQKKHLNAAEPDPSLPLGERRAAKEQLASLRAPPDLPVVHCSPRPPVHPKRAPSRRDADTLTEGRRGLHKGGRCLVEGRKMEGMWPEDELLLPRERARLVRVNFDSEEDLTEEELDLMVRRRPKQMGLERVEERTWQRRHYKTDLRDISRLRNRGAELPDDYTESSQYADRKETNGSVAPDEDYSEARRGTSSVTPKPKDIGWKSTDERLQVPAGMRPSGRSRSSTKKEELEFATGLMIGAADADAALQGRKERYRQELQEQIAEQQRNKKREKDLELRVAVTGATDPEKQADRIKPFGAVNVGDHARKRKDSWYPPGQAVDLPGDELNGRPSEENRERLPPEQPRVAFQSPLLDYSHTLGLSSGGISSYSQTIHRSMDTPRIPGFRPHPPSTLADAYRSPYDEAHLYYGARNPLDPNLAYYGQIPLTGGVQPMSYLSLPPAGPHPSQMGQHSPHSQHSGSSHPETPPHRPASDAATMGSGIGLFPAEQVKPSKESAISYKEALRQQIQERRERRRLDREEADRYEAKLEADMKNHNPWGRGGGGAPLRDSRGNLITDLHQMHKHNEEAYINPKSWQKSATATMAVLREEDTRPPSTHRVSGFVQAPSFARGNIFGNLPTPLQVHEQEKYKAYLKQQIEEKRRKDAEERERQRLEEEKEEKRLAEQRERIQREYEEEQDRKKRKEMDQKAKNEALIRLAEERKKEVERKKKKKEVEEMENSALRKRYEEERRARLEVPREPSPPIPTLQKRRQAPQYTPRPPSMDSPRAATVPLSERSLSGLQSPPVPARRNQLRAAEDQRGVISELSELRRQLRSEQKRLEGQLLQSEWEELDSSMSDRHRDRERPQVDVFDMARLRLQAPVRRPSSRNTEPNNLHRIHDSLQLRYRVFVCTADVDSRGEEGHGYCEPPSDRDRDGQCVDIQRQADYREEQRRINNSLRRKPADDYFDLSPPQQQNHYLRNAVGDPMRGSLLESDSAFIDPMGEAFPVSPPPEQKPQLSARERRRRGLAKRADLHNERGSSREPVGQPENYSRQSEASLNTEQHGRERNHHRTKRLLAMSRHGLRRADLSGDEDMSLQVSPRAQDTRGSVDTVAMEPWMRPDTSETLKRLMTGQTPRRERLTSRESAVQDWKGPSTYHG